MLTEVNAFIIHYGYLAIFALVFLQEVGIPNPVPNELVLIFSGYLAFKGILYLPLVILAAVSADFIGTNILYFTFYFFGSYIIEHKPSWLPVSEKKFNTLTQRLSNKGQWTIYLGRLTPFIRGYTSVVTGFLRIKPIVFLPIAIISALTWATLYIVTGRIIAPYWNNAQAAITHYRLIIPLVTLGIFLIVGIIYLLRKLNKHTHIRA